MRKGAGLSDADAAAWLQWGRNLIVAEGGRAALSYILKYLLQWGRNLIVAEGERYDAQKGHGRDRFNGAAT